MSLLPNYPDAMYSMVLGRRHTKAGTLMLGITNTGARAV